MPPAEYHLLASMPSSDTDDIELLAIESRGRRSTVPATHTTPSDLATESTAWNVLTLSVFLSLAISVINAMFLSARTWTTVSSYSIGLASTTTPPPFKYQSIYTGLDRVGRNTTRCLSRRTFFDTFFTYDTREGLKTTLKHVHAPEDEVTLAFGGPVRTVMTTYVPDYGLENCTFIMHSSETAHVGQNRSVDVYLLPDGKPVDSQDGIFLDSLAFIPGKDSMSHPFHCPARSHVRFELRCSDPDCLVKIPLQGVTSKTASSLSASSIRTVETGFRLNQYEAVACIVGV